MHYNLIMLGIALLAKLLETRDRVNRNFIWGPSEIQRKLHIVASRKTITKPQEGGLECHFAKGENPSYIGKFQLEVSHKRSYNNLDPYTLVVGSYVG